MALSASNADSRFGQSTLLLSGGMGALFVSLENLTIQRLPFFLEVQVWCGEEKLDMFLSAICSFERTLNLSSGELCRKFIWQAQNGCEIQLEYSRFASMAEKHLFVQRFTATVLKGEPKLRFSSGIDASVTTNGYSHWKEREMASESLTVCCLAVTNLGFFVAVQSGFVFENHVPASFVTKGRESVSLDWEWHGAEKQKFRFTKYSVIATSRDCENIEYSTSPDCGHGQTTMHSGPEEKDSKQSILLKRARAILQEAMKSEYRLLLEKSSDVWRGLWENGGMTIHGKEAWAQKMNMGLYHLLRCSSRGDEGRIQICAKGFAGEAYYGRYFWDSEIYLLPYFIYTQPKAARSMLMYRYHTLKGARENAARSHLRGAKYPWQSGLDGQEQCSLWEYSDNELHVTADIAYAIIHYYQAADDFKFLCEYGLEILLDSARYWLGRVDRNKKGDLHLINIMGPDEYTPMSRDNGYTNFLVRFHCAEACKMAALVQQRHPEAFSRLQAKLAMEPWEMEGIADIAKRLPIPYDKARDLYLQSADFESYDAIDIDALWLDKSKPFGFSVSQEKIYRSQCLKQADTLALMTLFPQAFTDHQVKTAYEYYMPLTVHDSSLSPASHSLAALRLQNWTDVLRFMEHAMAVDFNPQKGGAREGIHIANWGMLWQVFALGFAGMQSAMISDEIAFHSNLPEEITELSFRFWWKGTQYRVLVNRRQSIVEACQQMTDYPFTPPSATPAMMYLDSSI